MIYRTTIMSLLAVGLLVFAGVGYAAFTSSVNLNTSANAGTLTLEITALSISSGPYYVSITGISPVLPATGTVSFNVGPFAPGDAVAISYTVLNTGSLPAALVTTNGPSVVNAPGCDTIFSPDSLLTGLTPTSLGAYSSPSDSFSSTIGISLSPLTPNTDQGCTATVTFTIIGSVGT